MAGCSARRRWAIAKTFATQSKPRAKRQAGQRLPPTTARRFSITWQRTFRSVATRSRARLATVVGEKQAADEVTLGIERIFSYAAWADKFDGAVHNPPFRNVALAMNEPIGTVGIICPNEFPLLGFLSLVMPVLAAGNTAVVVPSESYPLITGDLYQVFDTSDLPGGAVNIVTGYTSQLLKLWPSTTTSTRSGASRTKPVPRPPSLTRSEISSRCSPMKAAPSTGLT